MIIFFKEKRSAMSKVLLFDIVKVTHYQKKSESIFDARLTAESNQLTFF
jgi:hypothetical protein